MANGMYDAGREAFLDGNLDWAADAFKVTLIDAADYVVNLATHDFYDDVTVAGRVATSGNLGSKTSTAGVADAADITFSAVTGDQSEALVVWEDDAGAETADRLVVYLDTGTGFPVTPNGGDITVQWDAGANKIFKL